jgi:tetratricopeptide (TPR) repeat protein
MEQATPTTMARYQGLCQLSMSQAQLLAGHLEESQTLAERALTLARARLEQSRQAYALHLLGDIAALQDPMKAERAEGYFRQALTLADELGMRPLQAHCHMGLGTLYAKTVMREAARAELATAIELYRAMDMTFWLPQAEASLAGLETFDSLA